eukprot:5792815-Heterocapsa_arctica.AAC.1
MALPAPPERGVTVGDGLPRPPRPAAPKTADELQLGDGRPGDLLFKEKTAPGKTTCSSSSSG